MTKIPIRAFFSLQPTGDGSAAISEKPDHMLTLKKQDASVEYK